MQSYRSVDQGEYYITQDEKVTLVTTGMTECIAFSIVDKSNPKNRLLCHLDGLLLDKDHVDANIRFLVEEFKKQTECKDFDIYTLGGNKTLENCIHLSSALNKMQLTPKLFMDSKEFCKSINGDKKGFFALNPSNACLTMICGPDKPPLCKSFSPKDFTPQLSEKTLMAGEGLQSKEEKARYQLFRKANYNIMNYDRERAYSLRHCEDKAMIDKYSVMSPPAP